MHKRSLGLSLFGSLAIIVAACGGGATPTPVGARRRRRRPRHPPRASAPARRRAAASTSALTPIKVGVVTDVGQLEDKSFNQSSNEGAKAAADRSRRHARRHRDRRRRRLRREHPDASSTSDFDVIVTVGFLIGTDTAKAAKANPDIKFIGVDQGVCVDETGAPDATFACKGDAATLLPNYQGIVFAEAQPGYLAGIVAGQPHQDRHDRRRRRHERPGRRQLLARLRERRQVGQAGHQGPLPGDRSESGQRLQRPGQGQDDRRAVHRPGRRRPLPDRRPHRPGRPRGGLRHDGIHGIGVDVDQAVSPPEPRQVHRHERREEARRHGQGRRPRASPRTRSRPARSPTTRRRPRRRSASRPSTTTRR